MAWFKVDDTLAFHDKVVAAGNEAMGLWVRAGAWCSQMLTDGIVPSHMVAALGTTEQAETLASVGLWEEHAKGYAFHGWDEYQFTREEIEAKRKYERDRKRDQRRNALGQYTGVTAVVPKGVPTGHVRDTEGSPTNPSLPDPSHPDNTTRAAAPEEFDRFWAKYPRKIGKGQAVKAWKAATKKAEPEAIISGLNAHLPQWAATEEKFIPHAATWLNGERWTDEVTQPKPTKAEGWWSY